MRGRALVRPELVAAIIVAAAAALRIAFFSGAVLFDDAHYLTRAWALAQGQFDPPTNVFGARIGLVGPAALLYAAFGVGKVTTGAFAFLCSLGSVVAAFAIGRRLFDDRTGLFAAGLVAVFPMDVLYAGTLFASAPETFFAGLAVGLFLLAERQPRPRLYFASGLCLGMAALVHETALLVLVFYPAYCLVIARARPPRRHAWLAAGLLLALAVDPLIHGLMGSPAARLAVLTSGAVSQGTSGETDLRGFNVPWLSEPLLRMTTEQELGLFPLLLAPLALLRLRRREDATTRTLALFLVVVAFWILYGTISPVRYAPLGRLPRYLASLVLPAAWLLGRELAERRAWRTRAAVTAGLVATSIACVACDGGRARLVPYERLRAAIAASGATRVAIEPAQNLGLLFTEGFRPRYAVERLDDATAPPAGAFAVAASPELRSRLALVPGAERLASIPRPDTLYAKLLRTRPALALLRLTRPDYRVRDLVSKTQPWALELYRLPAR